MNSTLITILLIVNSIVCVFVTKRLSSGKIVGRLRIDRSDPEDGPYMFAEIFKGVGDISKMKYVTFEVCNEDYIPQQLSRQTSRQSPLMADPEIRGRFGHRNNRRSQK